MKIFQRKLENTLQQLLFKGKALIITGARQVGKTTMLKSMFGNNENTLWINADEGQMRERLTNPSIQSLNAVLGNYKIVIIDEIQRIQNAGLLLKLMIDNFKDVQFIATGSSALGISDNTFEPLTGRFFLFHLYPFSLMEIYSTKSPFEVEQELPFHLVYGSYPEVCTKRDLSQMILSNLSDQYLYKDVLVWKDIRKPDLLNKLLKLLAFQIGSEVSINEPAITLKVKSETVVNYIDLLEKSFVVFKLKPYSSNARKEIVKMNKIYFWDNGIRNSVIDNFDDLSTRQDHGQLFENFLISERLKTDSLKGNNTKSYFWRNYNKSEVDYVELNKNIISAFEIKWNSKKKYSISKAFTNIYPDANCSIITPKHMISFIG